MLVAKVVGGLTSAPTRVRAVLLQKREDIARLVCVVVVMVVRAMRHDRGRALDQKTLNLRND